MRNFTVNDVLFAILTVSSTPSAFTVKLMSVTLEPPKPPNEFTLSSTASQSATPEPARVEEQLNRTLADRSFARSDALCTLLRHLIRVTLEGHADRLKEYTLGVEVFGRGNDFDPRIDPIVRVQARNLRAKLDDYYGAAGAQDPVRIELPKGSYVPVFRWNEPATASPPAATDTALAPARGHRARPWVTVSVIVLCALSITALVAFRMGEEMGASRARETVQIAVSPFESSTLAPETPVLARVITEEVTIALQGEQSLALLPAPNGKSFRLGGEVACYGGRVVVKAQLYRGAKRIWSGTYERLANTPDAIAHGVLKEMQPRLRSLLAVRGSAD